MLKGIPSVISPDLIKILMEMGHGDEIVLADGNFPSTSCAKRLIRADGLNIPELLEAILQLFPLDSYVEKPVVLMDVVAGDSYVPTIWKDFNTITGKNYSQFNGFQFVERFQFYEKAKEAYAIVATSEKALYANIILKKGVI